MGKKQELPALCCSDMGAPSYPYCPRSQLLKGSNLCVGLSSLHRRSSYQHWHGPGSSGTAQMLCYAPSPSAVCLIQHLKWQSCFLIQERESKQCLMRSHGSSGFSPLVSFSSSYSRNSKWTASIPEHSNMSSYYLWHTSPQTNT